jgi:predicted HAD superfamily phosphohydrolase
MVNETLSTKDSIRLGQAMNIVGNKFAQKDADFTVVHVQERIKEQVLSLYDVFEEIETELIEEKKEEAEINKKPMGFPKKV